MTTTPTEVDSEPDTRQTQFEMFVMRRVREGLNSIELIDAIRAYKRRKKL